MAMWALLALVAIAGSAQASFFSTKVPTTVENYPSVVQVDFRGVFSGTWGQSCAGHILSSYYILSAARCFHGVNYDRQNRRIRAGSTYRETNGVLVYVEWESNHPTYGLHGNDGDISVVRLSSSLEYSSVIQPGAIIAQGFDYPDALPVVHAGWGTASLGGSASSELLETTVYTVNNNYCQELYEGLSIPETVTANMICARGVGDDDTSACQGDSGGPLYHKGDDSSPDILIGVVSWGDGCSNREFPGVSTSVASYSDWVVASAV